MAFEHDYFDRPLRRKYFRIERERRFLLDGLPAQVDPKAYHRLVDNYLAGTTLRLRRVESPDGQLVVAKLGQKTLDNECPDDPRRRQMTTIYLTATEFDLFKRLPGRKSTKRRYQLQEQDHTFCIDVYEWPPESIGTIIAEVECETDPLLAQIRVPPWAIRDITDEAQWSGYRLSRPSEPSFEDDKVDS